MAIMRRKKTNRKNSFIKLIVAVIIIFAMIQSPLAQKMIYPYLYKDTIHYYSNQYGVDPLLVLAVIREESKFIPSSESHKGAQGLMQLMPNTAEWIAANLGDNEYSLDNLRQPEKNIQYGIWYLANLEKEFNNILLTIAAYNGGRGHVNEWLRTRQLQIDNLKIEDIPFEETREYVAKVLKSYERYQELYQ